MALTPVEIRHMNPSTGLMATSAGRPTAARRDRRELRGRLARARRPRGQGRAARGRPRPLPRARDAAAHDARLRRARVGGAEGAGTPRGRLILGEAHAEARTVQRDASAENERLVAESRKLRAQLRAALETIDDVAGRGRRAAGGEGRRPEHLAGRARSRVADIDSATWRHSRACGCASVPAPVAPQIVGRLRRRLEGPRHRGARARTRERRRAPTPRRCARGAARRACARFGPRRPGQDR